MLHPSNSTIHNCCASRGGAAYNPPVATPEAAFLPELPRLIEPEMVLSPACIDSCFDSIGEYLLAELVLARLCIPHMLLFVFSLRVLNQF